MSRFGWKTIVGNIEGSRGSLLHPLQCFHANPATRMMLFKVHKFFVFKVKIAPQNHLDLPNLNNAMHSSLDFKKALILEVKIALKNNN